MKGAASVSALSQSKNNNIYSMFKKSSTAVHLAKSHIEKVFSTPLEFINEKLFDQYMKEFPCLKPELPVSLKTLTQLRYKLSIDENDGQSAAKELAIDCILELLSGGDFEITWKDIFDIFKKEDQEAFMRIMSSHGQHYTK